MKKPIVIAAIMDSRQRQEEVNAVLEGAMLYVNEHPYIHLLEFPLISNHPLALADWTQIDGILAWLSQDFHWILDIPKPKVNCTSDFPAEAMPTVTYDGNEILNRVVHQAMRLKVQAVVFLKPQNANGILYQRWKTRLSSLLAPLRIDFLVHELPSLPDPAQENQRLFFPDPAREPTMIELLTKVRKPCLILADSYLYGNFANKLIRQLGFAIPLDIAILVVGDTRYARQADPALSVIPLPGKPLGFEAMKYLHGLVMGQTLPAKVRLSPPGPILRASTDRPVETPHISQAMELIRLYGCDGLTVNELALQMKLSRASLLRQFIWHYGKTPKLAIHEERLRRIQEWLDNTELSCARIAKVAGFRDAVTFCRFFKKETGMTPNEYRNRKRN